jgi:hypothetical protein
VTPEDVEIVLLRPDEVMVDKEHFTQRDFRVHHARAISKEYSPALFGIGHVSLRDNGKYYVLDSQHRCAAAIMAGRGDERVPFKVWRGLTIAGEAKKFLELNAGKLSTSSFDKFRVGVTAGNPTNVEIVRILESFGLTYAQGNAEGTVRAVDALVQIYEGRVRAGAPKKPAKAKPAAELPQSHILSRTLLILTQAWGRDRTAFDAVLLKGVAALIYKHDTKIEGNRLARMLSKSDTPTRAIGKIRSLSEVARITTMVAAVQYLEGIYNQKLAGERRIA